MGVEVSLVLRVYALYKRDRRSAFRTAYDLMHLLISNIAQVILLLIGLAFKDNDNHSVFPLSPIEILWVNLITSSFLAIGLGLEEKQEDSMYRPPHDVKAGVFSKELITDKFIYGFFMGALCLFSFAIVAYVGPGGGVGNGACVGNEVIMMGFSPSLIYEVAVVLHPT